MLTASEVADYMIAHSIELGHPVSLPRLHCLLYYAQAWHLAIHDERLFSGDIEASVRGPVVPSIQRNFEKSERSSHQQRLNAHIVEHVECIVERYGAMTADQLRGLTQTEPPWIVARERRSINERMLILDDEMRLFYCYGSQDLVTRMAISLCYMAAAINALGFQTYMATM